MSEMLIGKWYKQTLLKQITEKRELRNIDGTWATLEAKELLGAAGIKTATTYPDHRQGLVYQWVDLRAIFEVCER